MVTPQADSRRSPPNDSASARRILAICYSQSGDAARCADAFLAPLMAAGAKVDQVNIHPVQDFPFPWKSIGRFFDVMPDCIRGLPREIHEPEIDPEVDYDLIVLFYQVWFLSPSLPIMGLLEHPKSDVFRQRKVITMVVCRNMWLVAAERLHKRLQELESIHLDNIAVTHPGPIWATFITTPRLLLYGRRDRLWNMLPEAGVDRSGLERVGRFGDHLAQRLELLTPDRTEPFFSGMQATKIESKYILPELAGRRFFLFWAHAITWFGRAGGRWCRRLFVYLFVLALVLGVGVGIPLLFLCRWLAYPLTHPLLRRYRSQLEAPSDPPDVKTAAIRA